MAPEVRADPVELAHLAGTFLDGGLDLGAALQTAQASLPVPAAAFGDSAAAASAFEHCETFTEQAGRTVERLIEILEGDVDRLYRVAFAYHDEDQRAAELIGPGPM